MTVNQLPDLSQTRAPVPFLACDLCGGRYSAHRGDYVAADPRTELACCGVALRLVREEMRLIPVAGRR